MSLIQNHIFGTEEKPEKQVSKLRQHLDAQNTSQDDFAALKNDIMTIMSSIDNGSISSNEGRSQINEIRAFARNLPPENEDDSFAIDSEPPQYSINFHTGVINTKDHESSGKNFLANKFEIKTTALEDNNEALIAEAQSLGLDTQGKTSSELKEDIRAAKEQFNQDLFYGSASK